MTLRELGDQWRAEAALLRKRGAPGQADLLEACAAEMDATRFAEAEERLTITEAAAATGYSASQLRRRFPGQSRIPRGLLPAKGRELSTSVRLAS